jgi:hypothetical protein
MVYYFGLLMWGMNLQDGLEFGGWGRIFCSAAVIGLLTTTLVLSDRMQIK